MAVRSLRKILVEFVLEHVMQMAEGFLLRQNGDVILAGEGHKVRGLGGRKRAAGRRGQRLVGIKQRVLEVRRVDVDLECREDANLALLEFERRKRAAREIVVNALYFIAGQSRAVPVGSTRAAPGDGSNCLKVCTP